MNCAYEQIQFWLLELSSDSANPLTLDKDGNGYLADKEAGVKIMLSAPRNSDYFSVNIDLIQVMEKDKQQAFEKALTLNLYQYGTLGASIAFDPKGEILVLSYLREIGHTQFLDFQNILTNLVDLSKQLKLQLFDINQRIANYGKKHQNSPSVIHSSNFIRA
ncbi:CesT family type III secretion system chaperone [Marinibactrum halimedae]|uniref:Uncharacterized protein n=1 Tax=Marinibactrum halimedae TaxID=1444977 RepID=A0AA37WP18_9GAMM|nr:CesT family type III secretion system chaperone [Marinibactrum halimedae]MCD9460317.1 CesT family type III secretion system chaperone [Marinibactrum halimedae]GLS26751.1 hypothetical protein GCM10007877_24700 [Marinibactrum halimedae]